VSRIDLRAVLVAVAVLAAGLGSAACTGDDGAGQVTVLGVWTDDSPGGELDQFNQVLAAFRQRTGIAVSYQGERSVTQVLAADVSRGRPRDVVLLPDPGALAPYLDRGVQPLDEIVGSEVWDQYPRQWRQLARTGRDRPHAVPVSVNLKSTVWYRPGTGRPPATFDDLVAPGVSGSAGPPPRWCLGMGSGSATSGWPGTDWVEDILLHQAGTDAYQSWAAGGDERPWNTGAVRDAWDLWARIAAGPVPADADAARTRALLTDFGDAARPLIGPDGAGGAPGSARCTLEHQASFALSGYRKVNPALRPGADVDTAPFPDARPSPEAPAWEVSADLAALFNDTPAGRQLIRFLASEEAQEILARAGRFSANARVDRGAYGDDVSRKIAGVLTGGDAELCFDASDLMPPALREAFQRAILEHLARPANLGTVLDQLEQIRQASKGEAWITTSCAR
jgi:alpha-glucoside transport system substrate-binding protein